MSVDERAWLVLAVLALGAALWVGSSGCGGAAVEMETARVAACQGAEAAIEEAMESGDMTRDEAIAAIDCTRQVCDRLHHEVTDE